MRSPRGAHFPSTFPAPAVHRIFRQQTFRFPRRMLSLTRRRRRQRDRRQTDGQPANENERRSEGELWKEFLSVSFYNMLRPVAGLAILVQPIPADQTEGSTKSDNPFDLAHYAGMQAWKQRSNDVRKLDYMKILLAELNKRGWSHEEKMPLLWFIEGVMHIEDNNVWDGCGQMHAAYPLRFAAMTRAIDSAKPPACFRRTNGKIVRLVVAYGKKSLKAERRPATCT